MIVKKLITVEPSAKCLNYALSLAGDKEFAFIVFDERGYSWLQEQAGNSSYLFQHIGNFYSVPKFLNKFSQLLPENVVTPQQMIIITLAVLQNVQPSAVVSAAHYNQLISDFYHEYAEHWPHYEAVLAAGGVRHGSVIKKHVELILQAGLMPPPVAQLQQINALKGMQLDTVFYIKTKERSKLLTLLQQGAHSRSTCQIAPGEEEGEAYEFSSATAELLYIESLSKQPGVVVVSTDDKFKSMKAAYQINAVFNNPMKAISNLIITPKISPLELRELLVFLKPSDDAISLIRDYLNNVPNICLDPVHASIINKLLTLRSMLRSGSNFMDIFKGHIELAKEINIEQVDVIRDINLLPINVRIDNYVAAVDAILDTYQYVNIFSLPEACEVPGEIFIIQGANRIKWTTDVLSALQSLKMRGRLIFTRTVYGGNLELEAMKAFAALRANFVSKKMDLLACPSARPNPKPDFAVRPRSISISGLEILIRDPYAYYARYILRLRPKERETNYAKEFGIMVHKLLAMVQDHNFPESFPEFRDLVMKSYAAIKGTEDVIMGRRIVNLIPDLYSLMKDWNQDLRCTLVEIDGAREFSLSGGETFTVRARSDRVDYMHSSGMRVIDYKSGITPTQAEVDKGLYPQLPIEALIHELPDLSLMYVGVNGRLDRFTLNSIKLDLSTTMESLLRLMEMFLQNKDYGYFAACEYDYKTNRYALLSRMEEWRYEI